MTYPSPPWHLQGYAIQTLNLVDIDRVRSFIPPELEIVAVLPGKTLASIYISEYQAGSVLEYNELIVAPALVRDRGKVGGWISHIYVDNLDSVAGGREIWGLPKEMAEFIRTDRSVTVKQQDLILCCVSGRPNLFSAWKLEQKITGYSFGNLQGDLLYFPGDFQVLISSLNSTIEIPDRSPFNPIGLSKPFLTLNLQNLSLNAGSPALTGTKIKDIKSGY
jgi:hypothetical protein